MPQTPRPVSKRKAIGRRKKRRHSYEHYDEEKQVEHVAADHSYSFPIKDCSESAGWETAWDNFYLKDSNPSPSTPLYSEVTDSDNCSANAFYVVLHKVFQYNAEDELDVVVCRLLTERTYARYLSLMDEVKQDLSAFGHLLFSGANKHGLRFVQPYDHEPSQAMRLNLIINQSLKPTLFVHGKEVNTNHDFWTGLPHIYHSVKDIQKLQSKLERWDICMGNFEAQYVSMVPSGVGIYKSSGCVSAVAYREDIHAIRGDIPYESTIRSTNCCLLVQSKRRCKHCDLYRNTLRKKDSRQKGPHCVNIFSEENTPQYYEQNSSG
ncbi:uncharacterized protein LOC124286203 [Haliotis rubra]|uniref:uncharacterized protein LOC124286203 n=1 Tax=Haliotis rubra TaxID=36100 RepID=UPI001EE5ACAF|nr:uncharacterized protein LOC124286203 [Haliotis rubra]